MTTQLDSSAEEILRDVARDPRSSLFAIDPTKLVRGLRDASLQASKQAAGWTSAERELLRTHRDEAARLLRDAHRALLLESSSNCAIDPFERPNEEQRAAATHAAIEASRHENGAFARELSKSASSPSSTGRAEPRDAILHASLRLLDLPSTRVQLAFEYVAQNQNETALMVAHDVLRARPGGSVERSAFDVRGVALSALNRRPESRVAFEHAIEIGMRCDLDAAEVAIPMSSRLFLAVLLVDTVGARQCALELDELPERVGSLAQAVGKLIARARRCGLQVDDKARAVARHVLDHGGDRTREVLHAMV